MTTAHRPTWAPAKGGEEQGGNRLFTPSRMMSAKDQPSHTKLKFRQLGQASLDEQSQKDMAAEIELRERKYKFEQEGGVDFEEERKRDLLLLSAPPDGGGGGEKVRALAPKAIDADESDPDDSDEDDSSDEDDEDEEALLQAELARIKKEREEEAAKKAAAEAAAKLREQEAELMRGNPLLNSLHDPNFTLKRRWDEDVVFRNQASKEPKAQKRFINDTIRNDFHRKFLQRYIK